MLCIPPAYVPAMDMMVTENSMGCDRGITDPLLGCCFLFCDVVQVHSKPGFFMKACVGSEGVTIF